MMKYLCLVTTDFTRNGLLWLEAYFFSFKCFALLKLLQVFLISKVDQKQKDFMIADSDQNICECAGMWVYFVFLLPALTNLYLKPNAQCNQFVILKCSVLKWT